jgi:hypothetical protein
MRTTDDRYRSERARHELALRLIGHEARTGTIRQFTDLSDDRIRRLYGSYFKHSPGNEIRRRRGRTPSQVGLFVKTPLHRLHAATLAAAFVGGGLLDRGSRSHSGLETGRRLCLAYERYLQIHARGQTPLLTIEWAWNLLASLRSADELALRTCPQCSAHYVHDLLAVDDEQCPSCLLLPALPVG